MSIHLLALHLMVVTGASATLHVNEYPHNLAWLFGVGRRSIENETTTPICETEDCRIIAKILKESINETVDPCDDFYEYACGNWPENNPIPPGKNRWSLMKKVEDNLHVQVLELLKEDSEPNDVLSVKLAKRYYRACMDHESREKGGLQSLLAIVNRIGGWPLIMEPDEWYEKMYTWQKVDDYYASLFGENAFHRVDILGYTLNKSEKREISISRPKLPTGSSRLLNEGSKEDEVEDSDEQDSQELGSKEGTLADESNEKGGKHKTKSRQKYANLIAEVAMTIAEVQEFNVSRKKLFKDIDDILNFMKKLHKIMGDRTVLKKMSVRDWHEWYNNLKPTQDNAKINWVNKVEHLFSEANVEFDSNWKISVDTFTYFENLRILLHETPSRTIVNYVHWRFISDMMKNANAKLRLLHKNVTGEEYFPFPESIIGDGMSGECIKEAEMTDIISYMYIKKYFPDEIMKKAKEMLKYIQEEVEQQILDSTWLNEESRNFTLYKLKNITKLVGYPNWYDNTTFMAQYYKGLMVGTSYFENALSYHRFKRWKYLRSLVDGKDWRSRNDAFFIPLMVNAMYSAFSNSIIITAADLQNPLFALSRPSLINFAIIGTIMGHEINHGFDDASIRDIPYSYGDELSAEWWNSVENSFNERVECFIDQYNNYTDGNNGSVSYGRRTRNENIADTMGLEATLGGYYRSRKEEKTKPLQRLPGLENFSTDQLFFLSFAILHCEVVDEELLTKRYDVHSSGRLRAIGPISNSENFAKSFNCPVGSPMNPRKKCNIWN